MLRSRQHKHVYTACRMDKAVLENHYNYVGPMQKRIKLLCACSCLHERKLDPVDRACTFFKQLSRIISLMWSKVLVNFFENIKGRNFSFHKHCQIPPLLAPLPTITFSHMHPLSVLSSEWTSVACCICYVCFWFSFN